MYKENFVVWDIFIKMWYFACHSCLHYILQVKTYNFWTIANCAIWCENPVYWLIIGSSCVTHILPFCGYFRGQEQICFNPLVTYNFLWGHKLWSIIAVCFFPLGDDKHRFVKKVHSTRVNGHWECGHNSNPVATLQGGGSGHNLNQHKP